MVVTVLKRKLTAFLVEQEFARSGAFTRVLLGLGLNSNSLGVDYATVRQTGFFLLTPSPWPIFSSFAVFLMLTGFAGYMNYYTTGLFCFLVGVLFVCCAFFF